MYIMCVVLSMVQSADFIQEGFSTIIAPTAKTNTKFCHSQSFSVSLSLSLCLNFLPLLVPTQKGPKYTVLAVLVEALRHIKQLGAVSNHIC